MTMMTKKSKIIEYVKKNNHLLLFLYWPVHFLWYEIIRIYSDRMPRYFLVSSPWDKEIPFCEWFVIPYCVWFIYIFSTLFYTYYKNKDDFLKANSMIIGCMFFSMIICTLFPSGLAGWIRPDFSALGRENILIEGVKLVYASDSPPRCVMPSMHVSVSASLFAAIANAGCFKGKKLLKTASFILSTLIILATVFIKQHSILDLFAGLLMFAFVYFLTYHVFFKAKRSKGSTK